MSNFAEARFGTNPNAQSSLIRLNIALAGVSDLQFSWPGVFGIRYQVQHSPSLAAPATWTNVGPVHLGNGAALAFVTPRVGAGGFYRILAIQPLDSDSDGLDDFEESLLGTNPASSDSDGDGMSDAYEFANGLNSLSAADLLDDSDGDRVPNIYEAANGTLAGSAASTPAPHFIVDASLTVETATLKKTIQAAVDAAPTVTADPARWTIIKVNSGTYAESVTIDQRRVLLFIGRCRRQHAAGGHRNRQQLRSESL